MPADNDMDIERNEGIIGCLSCLARNPHCLQAMMDRDLSSALILWIGDPTKIMHGFFSSVIVAHLATNWIATRPSEANPLEMPESLKVGLQMVNIWTTQIVTVQEVHTAVVNDLV